MASLIVRGDGSSNFARGHRWGTFPSAIGRLGNDQRKMDAENAKNWLDFLKLRASWGQNGNCNIDNFYYVSMVAFDTYAGRYPFGNNKDTASYTGRICQLTYRTKSVTWETSEQLGLWYRCPFLERHG